MRAASVVAALLALAASAASREELSAEKAAGSAAPPSACGGQCHNKYDVKVGLLCPSRFLCRTCLPVVSHRCKAHIPYTQPGLRKDPTGNCHSPGAKILR